MKKFNLIIILLFVSFVGFAQSKFIEVVVNDTVSLEPVRFQVNFVAVTVEYDTVVFNQDYDPLVQQENNKNILQGIKAKLEKNKYKVTPLDNSKANIFSDNFWSSGKQGWTVFVNGKEELDALKEVFDSEEQVATDVVVLSYADEEKAEERLIKKLIDKARKRANVIAYNSQLKVGSIIEVREEANGYFGEMNIGDIYLQLARNKMGLGTDYTGSINKTFIVKFSVQ
ncbi:SIMPL domain-containing protein [Flavobacterium beibuense]|uniref:SIMPL domain-containing protein n=1 Tax=Flavobacterium beibuense TaxID=657326 RepID=A0A444WD02_9FLAO|nr:SIMPL domain-containing protein [Flavobacterium beibuense]RYJ43697.1 hypothetical protein NU09_1205 [Flavobacterium beibuense]